MNVRKLEHYNIRTTRFEDTVRFYVEVLGMRAANPPGAPEGRPPSWIYDGSGTPAIHLTRVDPVDPEKSYEKASQYRKGLEPNDGSSFRGSGAVDHIAFECQGREEVLESLRAADIRFVENHVDFIDLRQIFLKDPNGITLELNFR